MQPKMEPIAAVKPFPGNPRKDHDVEGIARSLAAFGWQQPIVVWDGDGMIVAGHGRYLAAQSLGRDKVWVKRIGEDELSATSVAAYRLADNRTAEQSTWDEAALLLELENLEARERELAGFDQAYVDVLAGRAAELDAVDPVAEWEGMPEYASEDQTAWRSIIVHFQDEAALTQFSAKLGVDVPKHEKFMWFPPLREGLAADKRWSAE